jgi:catechol 2,3-dioxygenase-like lactoylglutathione lyase family enzyme
MALSHLEHFLIQPADIEATAKWWCEMLGMRDGYHPDFKFPVKWLYIGDTDVVHMTPGGANTSANRKAYVGQESEATFGTGVVDHVAFRAHGLRETMTHLKAKGVEFKQRRVNDQGLFQLFLLDPNGIKVELNFTAAEADGIEPELMASALPA